MSRIFISHSSIDNGPAIALRDWLVAEGWNDLFLDLDPVRGIAAGERWERSLNEAARRCEAVLFLISKAWLSSRWCANELMLARRLNKRMFGLLIEEDLAIGSLPPDIANVWQVVNLAAGRDHKQFRVSLPISGEEVHVTYSFEGLARLKNGLRRAGLHASFFEWPPEHDPKRAPYRGLLALESDDAGIFFGREAPVVEAIDRLRGLRAAAGPRMLVVLGASGAGKSSFLRAGLLPRLGRDQHNFLPLPVIRPERAAITGGSGLLRSLEKGFEAANVKVTRAHLRAVVEGGAASLKAALQTLAAQAMSGNADGQELLSPPAIVLAVDQAEELFLTESLPEAQQFLSLTRDLLTGDAPVVIAAFTIRSDSYELLQVTKEFERVHQEIFSLPPMPQGSYSEVIKGPAMRLDGTARAIRVDDALTDALLIDLESEGSKDALPLLSFTLGRLYDEYSGGGQISLHHYNQLGRVKGSIEAAIEQALKLADAIPKIPKDSLAKLALLRRGLIPWLATVDPDTGALRRRIARVSEIPLEARPLVDLLVEQRLLVTDLARDGERTVEPAHEALLRQWGLLQEWLTDDFALLNTMSGIKRAARDWTANGKHAAWLTHASQRLRAAEALRERKDLSENLEPLDWEYLQACGKAERSSRVRKQLAIALVAIMTLGIFGGGFTWMKQAYLKEQYHLYRNVMPYVLTPDQERKLRAGRTFRECATYCPEMVVMPTGSFFMGSIKSGPSEKDAEKPFHEVRIDSFFAVSKLEVTFAQWDACVSNGGCTTTAGDNGWGRDDRPVINVSWVDAKDYVAWLSKVTGRSYRLLSEAEWEYSARAGSQNDFPWGDQIGTANANCAGCGSKWDKYKTAPVGMFSPNRFGLLDTNGNVWEWVEDIWHSNYDGAPKNSLPWLDGEKQDLRVIRGGSWNSEPRQLRFSTRGGVRFSTRGNVVGFRIARTLLAPDP